MPIRALIIKPEVKDAVQGIVDFASKPENWYHPMEGASPPGDDPRYCILLNTYRCVFSFTESRGSIYRHLSVSVPVKGKLPNPVAFNEVAKLFGFPDMNSKTHGQYQIAHKEDENCIVAVFPITLAN